MTDEQRKTRRGFLALAPSIAPGISRTVTFCSHCGTQPAIERPESRVCGSCGLGLLLDSSADVAPAAGDAFLVFDRSLAVCAVSAGAEKLLATCEPDAVNRHITELLVPADAEAQGPHNLAVAVTWAARGDDAMRRVVVRPTNTFGVRITARIASCGPPTAALVVFE
jgi:hypothetical protein